VKRISNRGFFSGFFAAVKSGGFPTALSAATLSTVLSLVGASYIHAGPVDDLDAWLKIARASRPNLSAQTFSGTALTAAECARARDLLWADRVAQIKADWGAQWASKILTNKDGFKMPFDYRTYGAKPAKGFDLYISMHGGGETDKATNDGQWQNQIGLYQPKGIYLAPRAPTDAWNMWHKDHIDGFFDQIIQLCVAYLDVNPDRVYVMGYSAGGDGTYQMAPRMADRWAAAAMMAGYPNNASPVNLRNIGFTMHVGGLDAAYDRNTICVAYGKEIQKLQDADDPGFYKYDVQVHPGKPHWMDLEDKVALDWTFGFTRDPYPSKIAWKQDTTVGTNSFPGTGAVQPVRGLPTQYQFYWIALPQKKYPGFQAQIKASIQGQDVDIGAANVDSLMVLLNDSLLDLDKPVRVLWKGKPVYQGVAIRTIANLWGSLQERGDRAYAFPARLKAEATGQVSLPRVRTPERGVFNLKLQGGSLTVTLGSTQTGTLRVSDVAGKSLFSSAFSGSREIIVPLRTSGSGVYLVHVRTGIESGYRRIFVP
jgi:hypothetical protein